MALNTCLGCTTRYAVGASQCPHCGSIERAEPDVTPVLPLVHTACITQGCRSHGVLRRIVLRTVALGVLEVPTLLCAACGDYLLVELPIPLEDSGMPKITVHAGPSNIRDADAPGPRVHEPEPIVVMEITTKVAESELESVETADESRLDVEDVGPLYVESTIVDLREECVRRGLAKNGTKAELVARLLDDDRA